MVKIMETPIAIDDLGGKPPIFGNIHVDQGKHVQITLKLLFAISSVESTAGDIALKESPNGWTPVDQGFLSGIKSDEFSGFPPKPLTPFGAWSFTDSFT